MSGIDRRVWLAASSGCAAAAIDGEFYGCSDPQQQEVLSPTYGLEPVVGDGKWVWKKPPKDKRGYLEPRRFRASLGIQMQGRGSASGLKASTMVPCPLPEQKIEKFKIDTQGCRATIRRLDQQAAQLYMQAPSIQPAQFVQAIATFELVLHKEYHGYKREMFPQKQRVPRQLRRFLGASPGIQVRHKLVRQIAKQIATDVPGGHPWDLAYAIFRWVRRYIKPRLQRYTSVVTALKNHVGDCEERAATFVALCRASGIPARLVWVPSHNWAEFYLHNSKGQGAWIPAHTAAYNFFGWTGAHELVLQKGDRIRVPEKRRPYRLVPDWTRFIGAAPVVRYVAELVPLPPEGGGDAGPGHRVKDHRGAWLRVGKHPLDRVLRDGRTHTSLSRLKRPLRTKKKRR